MEWERDFEDCSYVLFWHMITSPWYSALWKNIPWTIPQSSYISLSSHSNIYFTLWYLHIFHRIYSHYHYKISISSISDISTLQHSILYSHSIFPFYIPILYSYRSWYMLYDSHLYSIPFFIPMLWSWYSHLSQPTNRCPSVIQRHTNEARGGHGFGDCVISSQARYLRHELWRKPLTICLSFIDSMKNDNHLRIINHSYWSLNPMKAIFISYLPFINHSEIRDMWPPT